jgi:hypothetical protein
MQVVGLCPTPHKLFIPRPAAKRRDAFHPSFVHTYADRGALPHTPQTFFQEKSLTKNLFNRLFFVLPRALTFA